MTKPSQQNGQLKEESSTLSKLVVISVADELVCRLAVNLHWSAIVIPTKPLPVTDAPLAKAIVSPLAPKVIVPLPCEL